MGQSSTTDTPASRARDVLQAAITAVCEIALDLEITWDEARTLFSDTLFAMAEERYRGAAETAAALGTSLRTAQNYRRRHREDPSPKLFNMRRRVLHVLDRAPADMATIEAQLPIGSDMNFAKSAVNSLLADEIVVLDRRLGRYRRASPDYEPWYVHARSFPAEALAVFFRHLGRHIASRFTPRVEEGTTPASLYSMACNIPENRVEEFVRDVYDALEAVDAKWRDISEGGEVKKPVLVACEAAFGRLGHALSPEELARVRRVGSGAVWGTRLSHRRPG